MNVGHLQLNIVNIVQCCNLEKKKMTEIKFILEFQWDNNLNIGLENKIRYQASVS